MPEDAGENDFRRAALASYLRALAIFPEDQNTLVRFGETLAEMSRFKEAELAFKAAIGTDPNQAIIHAIYARHLALMGRQKEAEAQITKARELSRENFDNMLNGTSIHSQAPRE
jgi:tetratricopeptide (TPR) repeat protein